MAKTLPYFPLYVEDFESSERVRSMTVEQVGLYLLCLLHAWREGSIPADPAKLAKALRIERRVVMRNWDVVRPCWVENGSAERLVNRRQEDERRNATVRSARALKGAIGRWFGDAPSNAHAMLTHAPSINQAMPRASGSSSVSGFGSPGEGNPLYARYQDLLAQWENPDGVDEGGRMWMSLIDSGELTEQSIAEVFAGLELYKASKKYVQGYRMRVDKWLIGRRWKDKPLPASDEDLEAAKWR